MDTWNPIIAETHVKRVAFWQALAAEALLGLAVVVIVWLLVVAVFSIDRVTS